MIQYFFRSLIAFCAGRCRYVSVPVSIGIDISPATTGPRPVPIEFAERPQESINYRISPVFVSVRSPLNHSRNLPLPAVAYRVESHPTFEIVTNGYLVLQIVQLVIV